MSNIERRPEHEPKPCHVMVALDGEPKKIVPADAIVPMIYEVMEYVPAEQLRGAVSVADVEQLLSDTSRYFSGDHVNAGVVVGEMRNRLRALTGGS
jgi:hypothetical protein